MRVLQINAVYGFRSTGVIVADIEDMLRKNGEEPYVAFQKSNEPLRENGYIIGSKQDWKYHAFHTRVFGKQGYASRRATSRFLKWVDTIKPDVVHLHNLHSNYINFKKLCAYLAKKDIATVITLHDCWYFTGKCSHYVSSGCLKWMDGCGKCPQLKEKVASLFFDRTGTVLRERTEQIMSIPNITLVGCSKWIASEAKKSRLSTVNTDVVYNGVNTSIFKPHENNFRERYGLEEMFIILGMADKWGAQENQEYVKRISQNCDEKTRIVIVGGNDHHKEVLSKYDNILVLGYINDRKELSDIYSSSNVFVNLTHADTLPTVNMESICCGTPVITFDACGSPELVDEDSGFVVADGDIETLISKIDIIKKHGCSFDVVQKQRKFDKNVCYEKYMDIYRKMLAQV